MDEQQAEIVRRFNRVRERFLESMEAVEEVGSFADLHARPLDDRALATASIAAGRIPDLTPEQHGLATDAVLKYFERTRAVRLEIEASGEDPDEPVIAKARIEPIIQQVSDEIGAITSQPDAVITYILAYVESVGRPRRLGVIHAALLTAAVGNFEVLVSGIVREFLRARPEVLRGDEAKYSLAEIEGFESLEEFRENCADRYAENLLRGSFEDWITWFDKRLKIGLPAVTLHAEDVIEVFQRRHLFVHNGGIVNRFYLLKSASAVEPREIGAQLTVDYSYLSKSIERLIAVGTVLLCAVMRKIIKPEPEAESYPADDLMHRTQFDMLLKSRFDAVDEIGRLTLPGCESEYLRLITQVNTWLAQKRLHGTEAIRAEVSDWRVSALNPRFRLARLALLDQTAEAHKVARRLVESGDLPEREYRRWPLLAEVRSFAAESVGSALAAEAKEDGGIDRSDRRTAGGEPPTAA